MSTLAKNAPSGFGKLPPELQLMIWEAMFPKTRVHGAVIRRSRIGFISIHIRLFPLPIVFQICSESRKVAQERFKRFAIDGRTELADCSVPYGYCNPKIDALYFPREALFTGIALKFGPFRRIAITINLSGDSYVFYPRPNTDFAAKTSDDRLHIRFVTTEDIIAPVEHILCDSVLPVAFPEPKPLTQAGYP
jgi:hypothetical protein